MAARAPTGAENTTDEAMAAWLLGAVAIVALVAGLSPERLPLAVFLAVLLASWAAVATLLTLLATRGLAMDPGDLPDEARALRPFELGVSLMNASRWPAWWMTVDFRFGNSDWTVTSPPQRIAHLPPRGAVRVAWEVDARARGRWELVEWRVAVRLPGSLLRRRAFFADGRRQEIRPATWMLASEAQDILRGRRHAAGRVRHSPAAIEEFAGVREFRAGDDPRRIHLVSSLRLASQGAFALREFEDPEDDDVCVILDSVIPPGVADPGLLRYRFEKALCFSVALCRIFGDQRLKVRFLAPARGGTIDRALAGSRPRDFAALEGRLAALEPSPEGGATRALAGDRARRGERAIVVVSLRDDAERIAPSVVAIGPALQERLVREVLR